MIEMGSMESKLSILQLSMLRNLEGKSIKADKRPKLSKN
ncbi:hypothetical protein LEP1GSC008_2550 [Leptospira kirschneri serovar Bulgarica str. Nikolaevo]|uniref:Uncharacterized protein n=1 Tax=Leptospira kirschneri serovar Bulgarica str. Nikolaevo TaxID=1240687 RepID=M6FE54_9LEPT|nr:hypothetical protein LEP1GSC008_2550 [Leptospira kirschneri serovar Bulgarica str. Nikolaevo]